MDNNYNVCGGVLCEGDKELVTLSRWSDENNNYNISPTRKDAMLYFLRDSLNNGDFEAYYRDYMNK